MTGLTDDQLNGSLKETPCALLGGKTPRYAMQTLGTEWGRNLIHPDLWVFIWTRYRRSEMRAFPRDRVVADDVRFPNEVDAIHELGGEVWRVHRPGCQSDGHESESYVKGLKVDREIMNDTGIVELDARVNTALALAMRGTFVDLR